jgi:hypothetical protein
MERAASGRAKCCIARAGIRVCARPDAARSAAKAGIRRAAIHAFSAPTRRKLSSSAKTIRPSASGAILPLMQTPRRSHLTQHRRQRLVLWALARLTWIASWLAGAMPTCRQLRQRGGVSIDRLATMVKRLILIRAAEIAGLRRKRLRFFKHGRDLRRRHFMRSVLGSKLRRALRHRDPIARIAILIDALTHLDAWATRFAKRLRCGFMRLWSRAPAPMTAEALLGAPAPSPACADSS